jgi:uncharacterized membrane protein YdcZ (DUF606 family)
MSHRGPAKRSNLTKAEKRRQDWIDVIVSTVLIAVAELTTFTFWHPEDRNIETWVLVGIALIIIAVVPQRRRWRRR